jgi:hypothetical protein
MKSKETCFQVYKNCIYFRIRGYGLAFMTNARVYFSERIGVKKPLLRIGGFKIEFLKP